MFEGFSPETIDFLWGIRMNNSRDWFQPRKQQYLTHVYEPMKALGQELFEPYQQEPGMILKVSRIYRDARLHHPDPYKDSLWLTIRHAGEDWTTAPCLYLEITPEGGSYGFGVWKLPTAAMERFRRDIAANPQPFLELIDRVEAETGCPVTSQCYKRPKPCPDPRLERFYAWKGDICCVKNVEAGPELFGQQLLPKTAELFRQVEPLYAFFRQYQL